MVNPFLAFLAGVLTIAAPCVLPMLPVVLGASIGQRDRSRPLFIALGFSLAFTAAALLFTTFSQVLGLTQDTLRQAAMVMLLVFGSLMIWPRPFEWLSMHMGGLLNRVNAVGDRAGSGKWGGLVLGMSLGAVFTPCAGPVLGAILALVATTPDPAQAALLLGCYSLGAALPMLGIAYGGQYASTRVRQLAQYAHRMQQAFGVLVLLTAVAMYFQYDSLLVVWLSDFYPAIQTGL